MKALTRVVGLLVVTIGLGGCVYGPFYDDEIASTTTQVTFSMFALNPGATVTAECATHYSGFSQFGSKVASTTPTTIHDESIYSAQLKKVIPASCWDYGFGKPLTFLRFKEQMSSGPKNLSIFDDAGKDCISDEFAAGHGPITAGMECAYTESSGQLRLFATH
jgi:hypothetical protein